MPDLRHQENINLKCQESYDARHRVMNPRNNLNSVIRDIYEKMDRGYALAEVAEEEAVEPDDPGIGISNELKEEMGRIYKMAQEKYQTELREAAGDPVGEPDEAKEGMVTERMLEHQRKRALAMQI